MEKNKEFIGKLIIVAGLIGLVALFIIFDLGRYFTLDYIKSSQESFRQMYLENTIVVVGVFMGIYILVTALSLPGATVLTLAGGGLFGLVFGTILVSFASSIGATCACLVSRFLLRDWVQGRFGDKLKTVNDGIEREGAFYLFSMRLIPVFPFFVINLVFGLSRLPIFTFYWVSQLGMLVGTIVFVNAGKELARIDSLSGILSPGLILSFAMLGIFPIVVKKVVGYYRTKTGMNLQ